MTIQLIFFLFSLQFSEDPLAPSSGALFGKHWVNLPKTLEWSVLQQIWLHRSSRQSTAPEQHHLQQGDPGGCSHGSVHTIMIHKLYMTCAT